MRPSRAAPLWATLAFFALPVLTGCFTHRHVPDLARIYNESAMHHDLHRNPVIVIPGILGSKLVDKEGAVVWGAFSGKYLNPRKPAEARRVALPMRKGVPLRDLPADGVEPRGSLDTLKVGFLGLPIELKAYVGILRALGVGGYRDDQLGESGAIDYGTDHYTCYQFDYDWRKDNVENAERLHEFIVRTRVEVQRHLSERFGVENADVKFDIVAHSMGGLLTRYYLRYGDQDLDDLGETPTPNWEGAKLVDRVVLIATPNAGSAYSLVQLVDGIDFSVITPKYPAALLGTFPSIYQLLPRSRHARILDGETPVDVLDPEVWIENEWGLADPREAGTIGALLPEIETARERRDVALDHQAKCLRRAKKLFTALDVPARPPADLEMYLVAGDACPTPDVIAVGSPGGRVTVSTLGPGDGTVTRASALMDERVGRQWEPHVQSPVYFKNVTFLFEDHIGLTSSPVFVDNVLFTLLEERRD